MWSEADMPVTVKLVKDRYRVCDGATGKIARSVNGRPVDGGGHAFEAKALRQCGHINRGRADARPDVRDDYMP
jgi:hypothetical protein